VGEHLVSQVYPASVPVEVFIDNIVELLNDELKRRGLTGLESGVGYELHKANGVRLDVTKTLDELGVEDGATLVLVPAAEGDSFEPQYESLSTGLARVGKKLFEPVTATTAAHTSLAILAMISAAVLAMAVRNRTADDSMVPSIVTGVLGLLVISGAAAAARWWPHRADLIGGFCLDFGTATCGEPRRGRSRRRRGSAPVHHGACGGDAHLRGRRADRALHQRGGDRCDRVRARRSHRRGADVATGPRPVAGYVHAGHPVVLADAVADDRAVVGKDPAAVLRFGHRARPLPAQRRPTGRRGCHRWTRPPRRR